MGVAGMSLDDFRRLTPEELDAVLTNNRELRELDSREAWERTRIQTAYTIQPHVKKTITPERLIPLRWDKQENNTEVLDREAHRKRYQRLINNGTTQPDTDSGTI